jgi:hypothetical protein
VSLATIVIRISTLLKGLNKFIFPLFFGKQNSAAMKNLPQPENKQSRRLLDA